MALSGSLFQNCAAATGNARPPTVINRLGVAIDFNWGLGVALYALGLTVGPVNAGGHCTHEQPKTVENILWILGLEHGVSYQPLSVNFVDFKKRRESLWNIASSQPYISTFSEHCTLFSLLCKTEDGFAELRVTQGCIISLLLFILAIDFIM